MKDNPDQDLVCFEVKRCISSPGKDAADKEAPVAGAKDVTQLKNELAAIVEYLTAGCIKCDRYLIPAWQTYHFFAMA
jgi:hypothetical protein